MSPEAEAHMQRELAEEAMRGQALLCGCSFEQADLIIEAGAPHLDVVIKIATDQHKQAE